MTKRLSILAAVAAALVVGLFMSMPARAVPTVTWQPASFDIAVSPGGQLSTQVTAIVGNAIPATQIEVTPSLAPYVASVEPSSLPPLAAGSEVTINLVFEVATGTPLGTIDGTLKLRKVNGTSTQARPLPIVLAVGNLLYPPDPGEAGKETLEGIDSDGDGVRDDIQRYIEITYPDQPKVRAGLRQYALPVQEAVLHGNRESVALVQEKAIDRAAACLELRLGGIHESINARSHLLALILDTEERSRAYLRYNQQLGGKVFSGRPLPTESTCDTASFGGTQ